MQGLTLASGIRDWFIRLNFREPGASTVAGDSDRLFWIIFLQSAFFFVLLMALMVYFTFKYRKRSAHQRPQRSAGHNTWMELSWSVIPTILLVWLFFEGFWGFADHLVAPSNAPELNVTARQWSWSMQYPNGAESPVVTRTRHVGGEAGAAGGAGHREGVQDTPIFVIPEKRPVKLRMSSTDVIHSFWVPDFRVKFDVFPNRYTSVWFEPKGIEGDARLPDEGAWKKWAGTRFQDHWVYCAEYCGSNHSEMYAILRVVPYETYLDIVKEWSEPKGAPWEIGAILYRSKGCAPCHSIDGSRVTGPSWKDLYLRPTQLADGTTVIADADYIRESIYTPAAKIVQSYPNQMTSYQGKLTPAELNNIIAYMKKISSHTPPAELEEMEATYKAEQEQPK